MSKVFPYVYKGVHKIDGRVYIGSRYTTKLKKPPEEDLVSYRTSSKKVRPIFDEFDWTIVAVFFEPRAAYDYEQNLIAEMWGDPLLLNGSVHTNDTRRFMNGLEGKRLTEAHKQAISISHQGKEGRAHTDQSKQLMSIQRKGRPSTRVGFTHTEETKQRISATAKMKGPRSPEDALKWSKWFVVVSPAGEEYVIQNLNAFCREHNLTNSNMTNVAKGKYKHHKGWTCRYFNDE